MDDLKFSIIIPVYNGEKYIEGCLDSILGQTYTNFEIIVIDGKSKDKTIEAVKKYADRIFYWVSREDSGQTEAINRGLRISTGDIVSWLNVDERYNLDTFEKVVYHIKKCAELVFGDTLMTTDSGLSSFVARTPSRTPCIQTLCFGDPLPTDATFWTRGLQVRVGGFLDEINYPRLSMDLDWTLRLAFEAKQWAYIDSPLSVRIDRLDASTNSAAKSTISHNRESIIARFLLEKYSIPEWVWLYCGKYLPKILRRASRQWRYNMKNLNSLHRE